MPIRDKNIINKVLDYKNYKFEINWASGIVIVGAISASLLFYFENKSLKSTIDSLNQKDKIKTEQIEGLQKTVNTMEGAMDGVNNTVKIFMENPPGELKYRIERLEGVIEKSYGKLSNENKSNFSNSKPPAF